MERAQVHRLLVVLAAGAAFALVATSHVPFCPMAGVLGVPCPGCGLTRAALPFMEKSGSGSIVTMSYLRAERVVPHYNVMGVAKAALEASVRYLAYDLGPKKVRVNAISAGPMNTLAARGIGGFTDMLKHCESRAPLRRNVELEELGATGLFLATDGAAAITGQTLYVDSGFSVMAM